MTVLAVGTALVPVRCATCNRLLGKVSPGAVVAIRCHRCGRDTVGVVQANGEVAKRAA